MAGVYNAYSLSHCVYRGVIIHICCNIYISACLEHGRHETFPGTSADSGLLNYFIRITVDLYKRKGEFFLYKSAEVLQCLRFGENSNPDKTCSFFLLLVF